MPPSVAEAKSFLAQLEQAAHAGEFQLAASVAHAGYRWGRHDRRTREYMPAHRSADAAIWESDDVMARRIRDQARNEPQTKKVRDALEDLIVGSGLLSFADPFVGVTNLSDITRDALDGYLNYALEADELFEEWFCDKNAFDVAGKRTGPEIQRMLLGETVERGGCLLVRSMSDEPGRLLPLQFAVVEYDQLDHSFDRPAGPGQNKIIHGIEIDSRGRERSFRIYDDHPYDDFSQASIAGKSSKVSADRVIHSALFRRPSQSIGVSWLAAMGQPSFDRDRFISSEITAAAKAALLLVIHKMKNLRPGANLGLLDGVGDGSDQYGNEQMKLGTSPVALRMGLEDSVEVVEGSRPIATADSFIDILDHDSAGSVGLSYYTLTGKYANTSFTSARAATLAEDCHIRPLQNWFAGLVALPVRREFHRQAIALGLLKTVSPRDYVGNPRQYNRFDAIGPGRDLLDPDSETNATIGLMRGCLTTLKQACAKRGLHWIKVLRQIALENHVLDVLDIALDLSKGQGGQAAGNTRSKSDQEEAAAAAAAPKNTRTKGAKK
jgi:lambda family phage portal protein